MAPVFARLRLALAKRLDAADERLLENLRVHVKNCAGPWKYPRWIDIRPDLPRTATGKIQRFKLRELES